jgi:hypothetical protein
MDSWITAHSHQMRFVFYRALSTVIYFITMVIQCREQSNHIATACEKCKAHSLNALTVNHTLNSYNILKPDVVRSSMNARKHPRCLT